MVLPMELWTDFLFWKCRVMVPACNKNNPHWHGLRLFKVTLPPRNGKLHSHVGYQPQHTTCSLCKKKKWKEKTNKHWSVEILTDIKHWLVLAGNFCGVFGLYFFLLLFCSKERMIYFPRPRFLQKGVIDKLCCSFPWSRDIVIPFTHF